MLEMIEAGQSRGLTLARGQVLRIVDPHGGQTGDLTAFRADDATEWLSNGRSFDYGSKIYFTTNDVLYSNKSNVMFTIVRDDVGRHDFLYASCSNEMYRIQYGATEYHPNCADTLSRALAERGLRAPFLPTAFNLFMDVSVGADGRLVINAPRSRAGDAICFRAEMDLAVAVSSCPAATCNGGTAGPLACEVLSAL